MKASANFYSYVIVAFSPSLRHPARVYLEKTSNKLDTPDKYKHAIYLALTVLIDKITNDYEKKSKKLPDQHRDTTARGGEKKKNELCTDRHDENVDHTLSRCTPEKTKKKKRGETVSATTQCECHLLQCINETMTGEKEEIRCSLAVCCLSVGRPSFSRNNRVE